jgi:hypothetical protein
MTVAQQYVEESDPSRLQIAQKFSSTAVSSSSASSTEKSSSILQQSNVQTFQSTSMLSNIPTISIGSGSTNCTINLTVNAKTEHPIDSLT